MNNITIGRSDNFTRPMLPLSLLVHDNNITKKNFIQEFSNVGVSMTLIVQIAM